MRSNRRLRAFRRAGQVLTVVTALTPLSHGCSTNNSGTSPGDAGGGGNGAGGAGGSKNGGGGASGGAAGASGGASGGTAGGTGASGGAAGGGADGGAGGAGGAGGRRPLPIAPMPPGADAGPCNQGAGLPGQNVAPPPAASSCVEIPPCDEDWNPTDGAACQLDRVVECRPLLDAGAGVTCICVPLSLGGKWYCSVHAPGMLAPALNRAARGRAATKI